MSGASSYTWMRLSLSPSLASNKRQVLPARGRPRRATRGCRPGTSACRARWIRCARHVIATSRPHHYHVTATSLSRHYCVTACRRRAFTDDRHVTDTSLTRHCHITPQSLPRRSHNTAKFHSHVIGWNLAEETRLDDEGPQGRADDACHITRSYLNQHMRDTHVVKVAACQTRIAHGG